MNETELIESPLELNREFATLVGIKPAKCFIMNKDTEEIRFYSSRCSQYKPPKGWLNILRGTYSDSVYPDFTNPENFTKLIEIQWEIFGTLGPQYTKINNESFPINYLYTKIQAIKICRSMGGGEMLNEYIERVKDTLFIYPLPDIGEL